MAKVKNDFDNFDSPYQTQPPKGAAEGPIDYGGVADVAKDSFRDPLGVLPPDAKPHNIGPRGGEG
jgi:hypothetical protein